MAEEKKQLPLRLSAKLYAELAAWAADDFRSLNGQIEYLLSECVRQRRRNAAATESAPLPPKTEGELPAEELLRRMRALLENDATQAG